MKLIETKTLGTAAASIQFTSIPQTFTDLLVLLLVRNNTSSGTQTQVFLSFNNLTSNLSSRYLDANGSSVISANLTNQLRVGSVPNINAGANIFGSASVYISNYATTLTKPVSIDSLGENNVSASNQTLSAGLWASASAVTSIQIAPLSDNFVAGSTISLYGILKGSDGITTAS